MKTTPFILTFLIAVIHTARGCSRPKTCREAGATKPGDYTLYLGPKATPVTIFCYKCKEYITLKASNYGNNACNRGWAACGRTDWKKIRIDPHNLNVIGTDYTFSSSSRSSHEVPYGQGGGCAGWYKVSGGFVLDLTGTGFAIDATKTKWHAAGFKPKSIVTLKPNNLVATAQCGGSCGLCVPTGNIVLSV
ncbi:A disintegrin and metalloproteinase with thrombospondin motifs 9-like [Tubulanus polymorphus]|uniref:A disintegrin and metalloproteinase with thrombospondin motifs 9-like n=1 Tax=Tubulanus polymorphus TaxID=672921 RepID=UPI003DA35858